MKRVSLILALVVLCAAASFAQVFDFTLVNKTGYDVHELYVSPADDDEWGEDVLGVDILANGNSVEVKFDAKYEKVLLAYGVDLYDMKVIDQDKDEYVWHDLKLEDINTITITLDKSGNGVASFQ